MSYRAATPRIPRSVGRRVLLGIVIAVVAIILVAVFTNIMTNVLWYRALGYGGVYGTMIGIRLLLFAIGVIVLGGTVLVNLAVARRLRPVSVPNTPDQQVLARYRRTFEPHSRKIAVVIAALVGLIGGLSLDGAWETVLGFVNRTAFGTKDPQFHMDAGFYVFTYPFVRLVIDTAFAAVVLGFFAAAITHYLFGGLRISGRGRGRHLSAGARAHLGTLLGIFMLLKAIAYWLDRYGLVHSTRGVIEGASFTDVHAVLPVKTILAVIALCCALLFFVSVFRQGMLLAGLSVGLLILSAILIGGAYPAIIQQFQVKPNQVEKESPYIARNIKATRTAWGLQNVKPQPYDARADVSQSQTSSADEAQNIRLVDPNVVSKTFQQLQQIRGFYTFNEALDVDRYQISRQQQTSIVAVRELPAPPPDRAKSWVSQHIQYTHGYGFVSADGNQVDSDGKPVWQAYNIPEQSDLGKFQPRIYFGEHVPGYSIVGGPKGAPPAEFDYASESSSGQQNTTYTGGGGVEMGSFWTRLLYALKFHDINILLSTDNVNSHSHILYDRDPRQMVQKAAPYLELDGDPYPAVVDGRVQWIVDGYTTTDAYPYSQRTSLDQATADTLTATGANAALPSKQVNYMRNSVKATVDAYDGTVTLYAWDPNDPMLKTWQKAFGNNVKPASAMSAELRDHIRYPEDMFKAQREILSRYHVTNPASFYGGQDFWSVPNDPTNSAEQVAQPPYYLESRMPGDTQPIFSLTSTLVPKNRPNLAAFVSVSSDVHNGYGNIRVLQLPRDTAVPGPGTIQGNFEAYAPASTELALLRRGGSSVRFGNLLTLPFGGGLLYAEPVYVQANSGESYPLLQRVLVSFGTKIGYAPTLDEAMKQVLTGTTGNKNEKNQGKDNTGDLRSQLASALSDAQQAYADGQAALKKGDFTAYGEAQKRLKAALDKADSIQKKLGTASTSNPSPNPSASGAGTPTPNGSNPSPTTP
ncbi:MAG: UPF0182 family protein [Streptosporangiales bacterium]|nr:UPF0182 family protein [Streptosporangiales bacterium]